MDSHSAFSAAGEICPLPQAQGDRWKKIAILGAVIEYVLAFGGTLRSCRLGGKRRFPCRANRCRIGACCTYIFVQDDRRVPDKEIDGGFSPNRTSALPSAVLHRVKPGE